MKLNSRAHDRLVQLYRLVLRRVHQLNAMAQAALVGTSGREQASTLEGLDPRVQMSISASVSGSTLTFSGDGANDTINVRLNAASEIEYSANGAAFSADCDSFTAGTQRFVVADNSRVFVFLGGGDDTFSLNDNALYNKMLNTSGALLFYDGGSQGTRGDLFDSGVSVDSQWKLTGTSGGHDRGKIQFSGIEDFRSGYGNDTITYDGIYSFNARIRDLGGTTLIDSPYGAMGITKTIAVAGDLTVRANGQILVSSTGVVSTRRVSSADDPVSGVSLGDSYNQRFEATSLVTELGSSLTANSTGSYRRGNIAIVARSSRLSPIMTFTGNGASASVTLGGSIYGQDILISSNAADLVATNALGRVFNSSRDHEPNDGTDDTAPLRIGELALAGVAEVLANSIPVVVMRKGAESYIQVLSGSIVQGLGNVIVSSNATADSSMEINPFFMSIGYSRAVSNSRVTVSGSIRGANVVVSSDANSLANMDAETNPLLSSRIPAGGVLSLSLAISSTDTSSVVLVGQGGSVVGSRNANVQAYGVSKAGAKAQTGETNNGIAATALAFDFATSDIRVDVTGNVTSEQGGATEASFIGIPSVVNVAADTIDLGYSHGWRTGQPVKYVAPYAAGAIGGLTTGETYYVIRLSNDPNRIMLAASAQEAFQGRFIDLENTGIGSAHRLEPELTNGVGVRAGLAAEDGAEATAGFGTRGAGVTDDILAGDLDVTDVISSLGAKYSTRAAADGRSRSNSGFGAAGSFGYSSTDHNVNVTVRGTASLVSNTNLDVLASLEERQQLQVESNFDLPTGQAPTAAASAGIGIGVLDNTCKVEILSGARLDAMDAMVIKSEITYPFLSKILEVLSKADFGSKGLTFNDFATNLGSVMDGKIGIVSGMFNTWSRALAKSTGMGISGAVTYMSVTNDSEAIVRSGARINRTSGGNAGQSVTVAATTEMNSINMAGIFALDLSPTRLADMVRRGDRWATLSPVGNAGGKGGVGGSVYFGDTRNTTIALIEGGSIVNTTPSGSITVNANEKINNYVMVQSGGSAAKFGVSGSVGITDYQSTVSARIGAGVSINAGHLEVSANSNFNQLIAMGATQFGNSVGVGATIGVDDVTRTVTAVLGDLDTVVVPGRSTIKLHGGMDIRAKAEGTMNVFTVAAAVISPGTPSNPPPGTTPDTPPPAQDNDPLDGESLPNLFGDGQANSAGSGTKTYGDKGQQGTMGIGISGDVSIDEINDTVKAYVNDAGTFDSAYVGAAPSGVQSFAVEATNSTDILSASGSVAMSRATGTNIGLAGSFARILLIGNTTAAITGGAVFSGNAPYTVSVKSNRTGEIAAGAAGGSGAAGGNGVAIAGSAVWLTITNTTQAKINGGSIASSSDIQVMATNSASILGVAGALAYGGRAGVGAGVAFTEITDTTTADISNAVMQRTGVWVRANNSSTINTVAGSIGAGQTVGAAGTVAINKIRNQTRSAIVNSTQTPAGPTPLVDRLLVEANDTSTIETLSGAIGAGGNVGFGGALAYNSIDNDVSARILDSGLMVNGSTSVSAANSANISAIAAGAAGSRNTALAGSVAINNIEGERLAEISSSTMNADGTSSGNTLSVQSSSAGNIKSLAGAVAGGGTAGVGAAVGANLISTQATTLIRNSAINVPNHTILARATQSANIDAIDAGGAGAGSYAGGGAVAVNTITTPATVRVEFADLDAARITVMSNNLGTIDGLSGGVAGAGTAAVGAAVSLNTITLNTTSKIFDSDLTAISTDVLVLADNVTEINSITAGGAGAGTFALGGSVSITNLTGRSEALVQSASNLRASDTILVTASDDVKANILAGAAAGAGTAAVGAAASVLLTNNDVVANVTGSTLVANPLNAPGDGLPMYTGKRNSSGGREQLPVFGVAVAANSFEKIVNIAAGAAGGGTVGVAGSVSVQSMDETTSAQIDDGSVVSTRSSDVIVQAVDRTDLLSVGGAASGGGTAGIGLGGDGTRLVKVTTANLSGDIDSDRDVIVRSTSGEVVTSLAATAAGGGSAAVAGSVDAAVINVTTTATISDPNPTTGAGSDVLAAGSVAVLADHTYSSDTLAGSVTGSGSASVGASIALPIINETTKAAIGTNARVSALASAAIPALTVNNGSFTQTYTGDDANQSVPVRSGTSDTFSRPEVRPPSSNNSNAVTAMLTRQRRSSADTTSLRGVAVTATNRNDIEYAAAAGAGSGGLAAPIAGAILVLNSTTTASVDSAAQVNQGTAGAVFQDVLIAAGSDVYIMGIGGSAGMSGGGSAAPALALMFVSNTTDAYVASYALVKAGRSLIVTADSEEEILSVGAGLALSGNLSAAGSGNVVKLTSLTRAYAGSFANLSSASVRILALSESSVAQLTGAGALGLGMAGLAASVGVNIINKTTQAYADTNAILVGTDRVRIDASSSEDIFGTTIAGAGGLNGGVAGAISVNVIQSDTEASVRNGAKINSSLYTSTYGDVNVTASNSLKIREYGGTIAGGLYGGLAGSVDVATIKGTTVAKVLGGASVTGQTVQVQATTIRDLDTIQASASGGAVGIAGSLALYYLSGAIDQSGVDSLSSANGSLTSFVDTTAIGGLNSSISSALNGYPTTEQNGSDPAPDASSTVGLVIADARTAFNGSSSTNAGSAVLSTVSRGGTTAQIEDGSFIKYDNLTVRADQTVAFDGILGAGVVGGVAIGGAVLSMVDTTAVTASLGGTLTGQSAFGVATVSANHTSNVDALAISGSGGALALGAQYVALKDLTQTEASLTPSVVFNSGYVVDISANSIRDLDADTFGGVIGGGALGLSYASTAIGGYTKAAVPTGARVASLTRDLNVRANSVATAIADAKGLALGVVAGNGVMAVTTVNPVVEAKVGQNILLNGASRNDQSNLTISADSKTNAAANATGVAVASGASLGVSVATADISPRVEASLGSGARVTGAAVKVSASENVGANGDPLTANKASAKAIAGGGAFFLGAGGALANATNSPITRAWIDSNSVISGVGVGGFIGVGSRASNVSSAEADAAGIGAIGFGFADATANSRGTTHALVGAGTQLTTDSSLIGVEAQAIDTANATSNAAAAGLIAGAVNGAHANVVPSIIAAVGVNSTITAGTFIRIAADSEVHGTVKMFGTAAGLAAIVGTSAADVRVTPEVKTLLYSGSRLVALTGQIFFESAVNTINSPGNYAALANAATLETTASVKSGLVGAAGPLGDASTSSMVVELAPVTLIETGSTLIGGRNLPASDLAGLVRIGAYAGSDIGLISDSDVSGTLLTRGGTRATISLVVFPSVTIQFNNQIQASNRVFISDWSSSNVRANVTGGAGNTIGDFLRNLFRNGLGTALSNPPTLLSSGETILVMNVNVDSMIAIGAQSQIVGDTVSLSSVAVNAVYAFASMSSKGTIIAEATTIAIFNGDTDSTIAIFDGSQLSGRVVEIRSDVLVDGVVRANADAAVSVGGADSTAITRGNFGGPAASSLISIFNSSILGGESVSIINTCGQLPGGTGLRPEAIASASGGFIANAKALADGTVQGEASTTLGFGSSIVSPRTTLTVTCDVNSLNMVRKAIARADTVVSRFEQRTRTVFDRVVRWLPWPLSSIVEAVARVITVIVEVFDFSSATELTGGAGATQSASFFNFGQITNAVPTNRRLRIDRSTLRFGPGPGDDSNIGWHQDEEGRIIVDDITVDAPMYLEIDVPNGTIEGDGEVIVHSVIENVEIINETDEDLVLGNLELVNGEHPGFNFAPQILIHSAAGNVRINNDIVRSHVFITDNGDGDVILTEPLEDVCADVHISATRNIIIADPQAFIEFGDVGGLFLTAGGDIGSHTAPLTIHAIHGQRNPDGSLNGGAALIEAMAGGSIFLNVIGETEINSSLIDPHAEAGGVAIQARAGGDVRINVVDSEILDDHLQIHHANGVYELANLESTNGSIFVNVNAGDLLVDRVAAPSGNVTLIASRNIIGGVNEVEVTAASATLRAGNRIGQVGEPLRTSVETLAASALVSELHVFNNTGLTIGEGDGISGLFAGDGIELYTAAKLVIAADVYAKNGIVFDVHDTSDEGEMVNIEPDVSVTSLMGDIHFESADGVVMAPGAAISAAGAAIFDGDPDEEDLGVGVKIILEGEVTASEIRIATGDDADTIDLSAATLAADHISIRTGGGDDSVVASSASETIELGSGIDSVFAGGGGDIVLDAELSDSLLSGRLVNGEVFDDFEFLIQDQPTFALEAVTVAGNLVASITVIDPTGSVVHIGIGAFIIANPMNGTYTVRVASEVGNGDYELRPPALGIVGPDAVPVEAVSDLPGRPGQLPGNGIPQTITTKVEARSSISTGKKIRSGSFKSMLAIEEEVNVEGISSI